MLKKTWEEFKNDDEKNIDFWTKIEEKSMEKLVAVQFASKFEKMTALGLPF